MNACISNICTDICVEMCSVNRKDSRMANMQREWGAKEGGGSEARLSSWGG